MSRTSMLRWIAMACAVLLAVMVNGGSADAARRLAGLSSSSSATVAHVVAHPDDDILFMNPDLGAAIRGGLPTVGIQLTGGESDLANPADYAAQRQEGTRASYARMAATPNEWDRRRLPAGPDRFVEMDQLRSRPDIRLVFLNLPEDNNPAATGGKHSLTRLWNSNGTDVVISTLVPSTGVVRESYPYRRDDVIDVLAQLLTEVRPSVIRFSDDQPDARYQGQWGAAHDHPDHVAGARFARQAAQRYQSATGRAVTLVGYRDYNIGDSPVNLAATDRERKKQYFAAYSRYDVLTGPGGPYAVWTDRSYYRWPRGGSWAARDGHRTLHAFMVQGMSLAHWSQDPRGPWRGPGFLEVPGPLRPRLTVAWGSDGRLSLVAQTADGAHVLVKRQAADGSWPPGWEDLAGPTDHSSDDTTQVGVPEAVLDGHGCLVVLVKNPGGGVSARREAAPGRWEPQWSSLGGSDVQEGVSAVLGWDGRVHVFASTRDRLVHWSERGPGEWGRHPDSDVSELRNVLPASPPVTSRLRSGGLRLLVRTAGSGQLAELTWPPGGSWQRPVRISTPPGITPPVVAERTTGALLAIRDTAGNLNVSEAAGQRPDGRVMSWANQGGPALDHPAAVVEPDDSVSLLALGVDNRLKVTRIDPTGNSEWTSASSVETQSLGE